MKRTRKKIFFVLVFITLLSLYLSCTLSTEKPDFYFDVGADNLEGLSSRSAGGINEFPNYEFSKYLVTIHYISIEMYNPQHKNGQPESYYVLLNRPEGEGIEVDLAKEKLSDVMGGPMQVTDTVSNGIKYIAVGLGRTVIVNGYLYNLEGEGKTFKTSSLGPIEDDGNPPEDWTVEVELGGNLDFFGYYNCSEEDLPYYRDAEFAEISMYRHFEHPDWFNDHITVESLETIEVQFPLDVGLVGDLNAGDWKASDPDYCRVHIESSTRYFKYYLKRLGAPYYTDMLRLSTDRNYIIIQEQFRGMSFQDDEYSIFPDDFCLPPDPSGDDMETFSNNPFYRYYSYFNDGTIFFDTLEPPDDHSSRMSSTYFDLLTEVGATGQAIITVDDIDIPVEYIRVE